MERHKGRIAQIPRPDGGQELVLFLHEALGLGEDDEVALIADGLEEPHRDGVSHTAVQQLVMADLHDLCGQRHGSRCLHPLDILGIAGAALVVDGVTGAHVGADNKKVHGVFPEGLFVKGVQFFRHGVVAELLAVQVAGAQQVAEAGIALIVAVFGVVADGAADLMRLVIAAEHRPGRHADGTVQHDVMFHQYIQNACGEHAAHGAAFQHKSSFHTTLPLPRPGHRTRPVPYIIYSILEFWKSTSAQSFQIWPDQAGSFSTFRQGAAERLKSDTFKTKSRNPDKIRVRFG